MVTSDLALLTAKQQASLVRGHKASAFEVVDATLARIHAVNGKINAFITICDEEARQAARALDRAIWAGSPLGPLAGVPVGLKDCVETAGIRTTAGSHALENNYPGRDATVVSRLKGAGAIIIGKTHLSEFATAPVVFGDMRNPWDPQRMAGASSGGSGAAVGGWLCPVAFGTDTGGSIRMPASFSGAVGLKPTYGRISLRGVVPLSWSLDHIGPITRTAEDMALVLSAVAGYDAEYPWSADAPVSKYHLGLRRGVKGLRLGVPKQYFFDLVDPEVKSVVSNAIGTLLGLGMTPVHAALPSFDRCMENAHTIRVVETAIALGAQADRAPEKFGQVVRNSIATGRSTSGVKYAEAQQYRQTLRSSMLAAFEQFDVLVTPAMAMLPPLLSEFLYDAPYVINGKSVPLGYALAGFAHMFNLSGFPAVSVLCGFSKNGLPIGMQLAARPFDEETLLRVAYSYQSSALFHRRRPPL